MRTIPLIMAATGLIAAAPGRIEAQLTIDTALVATALVSRMQLQPGERVVLVAVKAVPHTVIPALRARIVAAGAVDLGVIPAVGEPDSSWVTDFTRGAPRDREGLVRHFPPSISP
jgi:hypothetical protein